MEPDAASGRAGQPIRVLLVDDHPLVVEGLRRLLQDHPDIEVLDTVGSGGDGIRLTSELQPDVVVVDFSLPDMNGAEAAKRLRDAVPSARVVMLTGSDDPRALRAAIDAGCVGYLEKSSFVERLPAAIRAAAAGETFLSRDDLARLHAEQPRGSDLSPREREVLQLMAEGLATQAVADRLFISINTTRSHMQTILEKLGAHSRLEAVAAARRAGLVNGGRS